MCFVLNRCRDMPVSMRDFLVVPSLRCEARVIFRAFFDCSGLASVWAMGNDVFGAQLQKHFPKVHFPCF